MSFINNKKKNRQNYHNKNLTRKIYNKLPKFALKKKYSNYIIWNILLNNIFAFVIFLHFQNNYLCLESIIKIITITTLRKRKMKISIFFLLFLIHKSLTQTCPNGNTPPYCDGEHFINFFFNIFFKFEIS